MKESNIEGLASHDGPESCVGFREGVGEASTGERAGRDNEPRNQMGAALLERTPSRSTRLTDRVGAA